MKLQTKKATYNIMVDGAVINVQPLTASEASALRREFVVIEQGMERVDGNGLTRETFCRIVTGWQEEKMLNSENQPMPCTRANKELVFEHNASFVTEVLRTTSREQDLARRRADENLPAGAAGISPPAE